MVKKSGQGLSSGPEGFNRDEFAGCVHLAAHRTQSIKDKIPPRAKIVHVTRAPGRLGVDLSTFEMTDKGRITSGKPS